MTAPQSLAERRAREFAERWGGIEEKTPYEEDGYWIIKLTHWFFIKFSDGVRPYSVKSISYVHCDFTRLAVQIADAVCEEVQ